MSNQYKTFFFVLFFIGFMGALSITSCNGNSIPVENQNDVKQKLDSIQISESFLDMLKDSLTAESKEVINEPIKPSEPQPQYKLPTLEQAAQIQKGKDIEAERRNIVHNAFAQNAKTTTVWDSMYTQGINVQSERSGGVNLERQMNRAGSNSNNLNPFSNPK